MTQASTDSKTVEDDSYFSDPVEIPSSGNISPSFYSLPAKIINQSSKEINYEIPQNKINHFNQLWKKHFYNTFEKTDKTHLKQFLNTGKSNNNKMYFQIMKLLPNKWFQLHCHPNIEFIYCIKGILHEYRMDRVIKNCASNAEFVDITKLDFVPKFEKKSLNFGQFLANEVGSVHQSYSGENGCVLLVLWSKIHTPVVFNENVLKLCPKLSKI